MTYEPQNMMMPTQNYGAIAQAAEAGIVQPESAPVVPVSIINQQMRNLLDETIQQLSIRVSALPPSEVTAETYQIIEAEDIKD